MMLAASYSAALSGEDFSREQRCVNRQELWEWKVS